MTTKNLTFHGHAFTATREEESFKARDAWSGHTWFALRKVWVIYNAKGKRVAGGYRTLKEAIGDYGRMSKHDIEMDSR